MRKPESDDWNAQSVSQKMADGKSKHRMVADLISEKTSNGNRMSLRTERMILDKEERIINENHVQERHNEVLRTTVDDSMEASVSIASWNVS